VHGARALRRFVVGVGVHRQQAETLVHRPFEPIAALDLFLREPASLAVPPSHGETGQRTEDQPGGESDARERGTDERLVEAVPWVGEAGQGEERDGDDRDHQPDGRQADSHTYGQGQQHGPVRPLADGCGGPCHLWHP
jgi:hypothetical protein